MNEMATILCELLMLLAGFGICLLAALWLKHHDAEKDHRIFFLEWHNARLSAQLDLLQGKQPERPEIPAEELKPAKERKRRSCAKPENCEAPLPPKIDASGTKASVNVPPIPQAELGRMQAKLNASGSARIVFDGGKRTWTHQ